MKSYDGEFRELREFLGPPSEAAPEPPVESAPPPARVGKYRLLREIGRGGMAIVYEAEDTELRRRVALKVVREPQADPETIRRMQREAVIAAGLKHPHIVPIHDVGMSGDAYYIAMDLVEGGTLAGRMAEGRPLPELLRWLEETARAAAHAHSQGVVHRDLKPSNVLVNQEGRALLTDFGLARAEGMASQLTRTHELLGTPRYMAPEQVAGKAKWVDGRTDVYAMGVILYEMLTGCPPHSATTPARLYEQILTEDPQRPSRIRRSVDPALEAICMKAMEKNRAHRYASAAEFADDLRNFLAGEPIRAKRVPSWHRLARKAMRSRGLRIAGVAALALLVVAGGVFSWTLVKKQRLDRRRHEALQRLGTMWSTIVERKNELRQGKIDPERGRRELAAAVQSIDDHIRDWPDEPQGYYVRARGKIYLDDFEGARRDLDAALARIPDFRPGWHLLGMIKVWEYQTKCLGFPGERVDRIAEMNLLARQASEAFAHAGDPAHIQREFERWGLTWTREDWVMTQLGRVALFFQEDKRVEAIRLLEERYKEFQSEEFIHLIVVLFFELGDPIQLDRWTRLFVKSAPGYAEAHVMRGDVQARMEDYKAAIESYDSAIRIKRDFATAYFNRGAAKEKVGDLDGALADLDSAISLKQDQPEFYNSRALANAKLGRYQEALRDCARALELQEDSADAYLQRGIVKRMMGDLSGSITDCTRAIELNKDHAEAYSNRGCARLDKREYDAAIEDFTGAIRINETGASSWSNRGAARMNTGDLPGAIADLDRAIELDPKNATIYFNRGNARRQQGEHAKAIADYDRAISLKGDDYDAYFWRAEVQETLGRYDEAIADYDRGLELKGGDYDAYHSRGKVKQKKGDLAGAIVDFDLAIKMEKNCPYALYDRAKAKRSLGDRAGAAEDLREALRLADADWADRAGAERLLAELEKP